MKTMKTYFPTIALVGLVVWMPLVMALQRTQSGQQIDVFSVVQPKCPWKVIAEITDSNTAPGVDDLEFTDIVTTTTSSRGVKSYAAADANGAIWEVPTDARTLQLTFTTDANDDADVLAIYVCADPNISTSSTALEDSFYLGTTLTLTGGTQVGPETNVWVDTATATDATLSTDIEDSAANRRVVVTLSTEGMKFFAFYATTLQASSTLKVMARWGN